MKQNHLQAKHIGLYTEVNHKSEENSFHLSKHIYTIIKIKKRQYSDTKVNQILKDLFMTPFDAVFEEGIAAFSAHHYFNDTIYIS